MKTGVSLLINKKFKTFKFNNECINERLVKVEMSLFGKEIVFLSLFAPTDVSKQDEKEALFQICSNLIEHIPDRKILVGKGVMINYYTKHLRNNKSFFFLFYLNHGF